MPLLIAVAGLPGSGKSHYTYRLAAELDCAAFDDIGQENWQRWPYVGAVLRDGRNAVVNSAAWTDPTAREEFEARVWASVRGVDIEWRYFACDPSAALTNILRDVKDKAGREFQGRLKSFLRRAACYTIPEGAIMLPVYQGAGDFRVEYKSA